jgi:hypothetical protein
VKHKKDISPPAQHQLKIMEFDEINALINIEREAYQRDLALGTISRISHAIKNDKAKIIAQQAEKIAMLRAKKCAHKVQLALSRLNHAMMAHAICIKTIMKFEF